MVFRIFNVEGDKMILQNVIFIYFFFEFDQRKLGNGDQDYRVIIILEIYFMIIIVLQRYSCYFEGFLNF